MAQQVNINGRAIGPAFPPFVIAELSANHNGSIEKAFRIIEEAKNAGADAVKLQTYKPDTITIDCRNTDFRINGGLWDGRYLYDLYEWAHTPWEWHEALFAKASDVGITIFSSPFDNTAVDLLTELGAPAFKIASFELVDLELIKKVAKTGKPIIMSRGMANKREVEEAVNTAKDNGCDQIAVLQCVSGYPTPANEYNLKTISDISSSFDVVAALSDHTVGNATAIAAVALGANVLEKHVTLDRNGGGPDDSFSIEPPELRRLCDDAKIAWEALGAVNYENTKSESENSKFRRSLYFVKDVKAGTVLTTEHVRSIRPGYGLSPKYLSAVIGKKLMHDVEYGTPVPRDFLA